MGVAYHIVLGCPRSGTTFLMRVLNTVPRTACVSGTIFPVSIPHLLGASATTDDVSRALVEELECSLDHYLHSGIFNARATAIQKWYASHRGLSGLLDALRGRQDVDRLVYKEPFFSLAPSLPFRGLPESRIVYIHRDGRDCASSLVRTYDVLTDQNLTHLKTSEMRFGRKVDDRYVPWWVEEGAEDAFLAGSQYVRAAWMWAAMVGRCRAFFETPEVRESGRVLWVRYEDLVRDPIAEGRRVAEHLGLPVTHRFTRRLREAHPRSVGNYKRLPPEQVDAATRVARAELEAYGYL